MLPKLPSRASSCAGFSASERASACSLTSRRAATTGANKSGSTGPIDRLSFNVVSLPNEYTWLPGPEELTEAKSLYLEFWNGFKEFCLAEGTFLSLRKPRPQHWYSIAVGRSKFQISVTASVQKQRIGCEIYMRGPNAGTAFKLLKKQKDEIEEATGTLQWQELPKGQDCRVVRYRPNIDVTDQSNWEESYRWLKKEAEVFHKTFSPRIKALPLLDSIGANPEQEEMPDGQVTEIEG